MKRLIKIILITVLFTAGSNELFGQDTTLYKRIRLDGTSEYIRLTKLNDSIYMGVYFGNEAGTNGERYFYKSGFLAGKMAGNDLVFTMDNYLFTDTLYDKIKVIRDKEHGFPFILKKPMHFICSIEGNYLRATRVTALHLGSSADVLTFMRVEQGWP